LLGGVEAVHHEHINVEKNDVRLEPLHLLNDLFAISGFLTYLEGMQVFKQGANHLPYDGVVIHDKDSCWQWRSEL
jgi:hypothetical protein